MILTLMGAPGSGKGTQGRQLARALGVAYVASGDLIRRAMAERTAWGEEVRSCIDQGLYVPDESIVPPFLSTLRASQAVTAVGAVLDGFPRTTEQASALDEASRSLGFSHQPVALVLEVPEDVLVSRLSGRWLCRGCHATYNVQSHPPHSAGVCDACGQALEQRVDDRRDTIQQRLAIFRDSTSSVLAYYGARGGLVRVDGNQSEQAVGAALLIAARSRASG